MKHEAIKTSWRVNTKYGYRSNGAVYEAPTTWRTVMYLSELVFGKAVGEKISCVAHLIRTRHPRFSEGEASLPVPESPDR